MGKNTKTLTVICFIVFILALGLSALILSGRNTSGRAKDTLCQDCNVVLITMTNLRFDHMSGSGYFRPTTPNLDKLAKESLIFDNAFSVASWTLPDTMSIYTSLFPPEHGVMNRYSGSTLPARPNTLIDIANKAGFISAAFTGGFDYNTKFGLTNRFNFYDECAKGQLPTYPRQPGPRGGPSDYGEFSCTAPLALGWLKQNAGKKFFLHVQGFDAHCPFSLAGGKMYDPGYQGTIDYSECLWTYDRTEPQVLDGKTYYPVFSAKTSTDKSILLSERDIKHLIAIYDESVTLADLEIGRVITELKALGLWDNTIVIFTSEHGDMFGKYGRFMRGGPIRGTFYDDVLHVPLLMRHPNIAPRRIQGLVSHVDLMPTILEFLGLSSPFRMSGKSLMSLINEGKEVNNYIFAGSQFIPNPNNPYFGKGTKIYSIRNKKWKLISETIFEEDRSQEEKIELYDIEKDKEELANVAEAKPHIVKELKSKLPGWARK